MNYDENLRMTSPNFASDSHRSHLQHELDAAPTEIALLAGNDEDDWG